jgi:CRISPR system Cascade subunit CasC
MIVELHIIQNFAPSNLNRDDTNAPKDCTFGGFRRARISSQCIKRSVRNHGTFKKAVEDAGGTLAYRTKRVIGKLAEMLSETYGKGPEESQRVAEKAIALFGIKRDDKWPDRTKIILFLGGNELRDIAGICQQHWDTILASEVAVEGEETDEEPSEKKKKKGKKIILTSEQKDIQKTLQTVVGEERIETGGYAADIALFGRMVADKNVKNMNVDAACQVAHAISTHKVEMEMDYFTAVDDLLPEEESGSDMIGVVEFNSSCFYRYSLVDLAKLRENLGFNDDLLKGAVRGYLEASIKAIPTGKQNSMAAQNPAGYARILIRKDGFPWSLANAFEKPVRSERDNSIEELSIAALNNYLECLKKTYDGGSVVIDACINVHDKKSQSLEQVLQQVLEALSEEKKA